MVLFRFLYILSAQSAVALYEAYGCSSAGVNLVNLFLCSGQIGKKGEDNAINLSVEMMIYMFFFFREIYFLLFFPHE